MINERDVTTDVLLSSAMVYSSNRGALIVEFPRRDPNVSVGFAASLKSMDEIVVASLKTHRTLSE
jgi:hypothetical protein